MVKVLDIDRVQVRVPFLLSSDGKSSEWDQFMEFAKKRQIDLYDDVCAFWGMEPSDATHQSSFSFGVVDYDIKTALFWDLGFRPAFQVPPDVLETIEDGEDVIVGTLYMNGTPLKFDNMNAYNYEKGAKLQFRQALDDPEFAIHAIKFNNTLFATHALLNRISWMDIVAQGDF